ncbi:MAG: hypothetical protein JWO54_495 [Candidatus Saccharibacteria bacterium]|nr:hypothetical protein [Candidatus Saccharibacteria bacterium]
MTVANNTQVPKTGWIEATKRFVYNKGDIGKFNKAAAVVAASLRTVGLSGTLVSLMDEAAVVVPGINLITTADNIMWIYGAFALYRINKIRRQLNRLNP